MKKIYTLAVIAAAGVLSLSAENKFYDSDEMGALNGVSDNGLYAAIADEDNNLAYLWDASKPNVFTDITLEPGDPSLPSGQRVKGSCAYDVSDNGTVVGFILYADGHEDAAFRDPETGEWIILPRPVLATNTVEALFITPDCKTIGGYFCQSNKELGQGQYFPCQWTLGEDGEYELHEYNKIPVPHHQGFFPRTQTSDGKVMGGMIYAGIGSVLPALIVEGELKMFYDITYTNEPFTHYFNGVLKYYCGLDEEKHQIWTEDANDPNIIYYPEELIDGFRDPAQDMQGFFNNCDDNGNFYGVHPVLVEDSYGNTDVINYATIYNINNDNWNDSRNSPYMAGIGDTLLFTMNDQVIDNGVSKKVEDYYDFTAPAPKECAGVTAINSDATVVGGVLKEFVEAIGDYFYYPFVVTTAENGVATTFGGDSVSFLVSRGHVEVLNAAEAVAYDLAGRTVAHGTSLDLPAGTYVINAEGTSATVIVK